MTDSNSTDSTSDVRVGPRYIDLDTEQGRLEAQNSFRGLEADGVSFTLTITMPVGGE